MIRLLQGDLREVLPALAGDGFDSCVTDPPYELGFMGRKWDASGVANDPATWRHVLRVLKPGAYLLAFGGTRTHHRMMCAIEDAGFEIRDMVMWVYGSGFPKSKNLVGAWQGWGTALKPAWEPIIVARKPLRAATVQASMEAGDGGALNIDGCRIQTGDDLNGGAYAEVGGRAVSGSVNPSGMNVAGKTAGKEFEQPPGRWPANLIHDGSEEVVGLFPDAPGQQRAVGPEFAPKTGTPVYGDYGPRLSAEPRGDSGSAARFYYCAKADRQDRDDGLEHRAKKPLLWSSGTQNPGAFQSPNTDRSARNPHPTVKPTDLMQHLVRLVTRPGGAVLDPFMGSGSTGRACLLEGMQFIGIEREAEYVEIARDRIRAIAPLLFNEEAA